MSGMNPVVLIQMMLNYHWMAKTAGKRAARTFVFQKNNLMRVHKETEEEIRKRKSWVSKDVCCKAESVIRRQLMRTLHGRAGKVWIDPELSGLAVPLEMATGNSGFGVLPTGSRIKIPEGKFIRAFTYWEKVNDIDLSVFGLTENGEQKEYSWRTMWQNQSQEITYSGDQTSGYNGGSEYFDVNVDLFRKNHPETRYLIFCDNVYTSGVKFSDCLCKAGFMIREILPEEVPAWKGELATNRETHMVIFDPKTVHTSWQCTAESSFAYLFAIDLETREMVWLNVARKGDVRVAGETDMSWLMKYLEMANVFNISTLFNMAGDLVSDPKEADIQVTDRNDSLSNITAEVIHSWDFEKMLRLLASS